MAGVVKNLMVRAGADFSAITKQSNKAKSSIRSMADDISRSCAIVKKAFSAVGIGLSVAGIVSFGKQAAEAYDAQVESEVRLARVMRNTMDASNAEIQSILDLTGAQQKLGIVGDEVQLAGAQELATYLSLSDSLRTLIPVMNDMAVQQYGFNVTAEQTANIATMLGKVMEGQVGGLSRYGYYFDAAQEAVLKYGTEAERAAMLAEVVEQSVGGMNAALAATPTGRMVQLNNALGDIKERFGQAVRTIGTAFLPLLNGIASVLASIATLANKAAQSIANVFGGSVAGREWQYVPPGAAAAAEDAAAGMDDLADSTKAAGKAAKDYLTQADFDTLHILKDNSSDSTGSSGSPSPTSTGGGAAAGITQIDTAAEEATGGLEWLQRALEKLKAARDSIDFGPLVESFEKLEEKLRPFTDLIGDGLAWGFDNVLVPLGKWFIEDLAPTTVDTLANAVDLLGAIIEKKAPEIETLGKLLDVVGKIVGGQIVHDIEELGFTFDLFGTLIREGPAPALDLLAKHGEDSRKRLKDSFAGFDNWIGTNIGTPIENAVERWEDAHGSLDDIAQRMRDDLSAKAAEIGSRLGATWSELRTSTVESFRQCGANASAAVNSFCQNLSTRASAVKSDVLLKIEQLKNGAIQHFETLRGKVEAIITKIKNAFNFQWRLPQLKLPHINISYSPAGWALQKFLGISSIPHLSVSWYAKGGIVDGATLIGAGEAGKEAIIPLERNTEWISKVAKQLKEDLVPAKGFRVDTPDDLLSSAIREGSSTGMIVQMLDEILDAILAGHDIVVDRDRLGKIVRRGLAEYNRVAGPSRA